MIYEFQATQDLHGWPKPWAPGANVNLLPDVSNKADRLSCTIDINDNAVHLYGKAAGSGGRQYLRTSQIEWPAGTYYIYEFNKSAGTAPSMVPQNDTTMITLSGGAITLEESIEKFSIGYNLINDTEYNYYCDLLIATESGITSWSPYANVCMPEGFNIWDPINAEYIQVYAGYVNANTRELYLRPVYPEYAGEELVGPWMSSLDPYEEDTTPTEGAFVIDFGGELTSYEITPFMLQTLLDSLGIRQHFTNGAGLLNSLMDQAQGRVRSEEELLHLSRPLKVIAIGEQLPAGLTFKPISKDVLPGLPGKFIR